MFLLFLDCVHQVHYQVKHEHCVLYSELTSIWMAINDHPFFVHPVKLNMCSHREFLSLKKPEWQQIVLASHQNLLQSTLWFVFTILSLSPSYLFCVPIQNSHFHFSSNCFTFTFVLNWVQSITFTFVLNCSLSLSFPSLVKFQHFHFHSHCNTFSSPPWWSSCPPSWSMCGTPPSPPSSTLFSSIVIMTGHLPSR